MKNLNKLLAVLLAGIMAGCSSLAESDSGGRYSESPSAADSGDPENGGGQQHQAGVITAGEWNDLDNWTFWQELIVKDDYKGMSAYWSFHLNNRVAVDVATAGEMPVVNVEVVLKRNGATAAEARTNNKGRAELWIDPYQFNDQVDFATLSLEVDGKGVETAVTPYEEGVCKVTAAQPAVDKRIEIAFMVDATGSMGDELEYLKTELVDVIDRVEDENAGSSILTGAVFYRDEGDDYVTRMSNFTGDISVTNSFIKAQRAAGGGDYPEAVHTALDKTVNELQWTTAARTKILFILLDAPPHYQTPIIQSIQTSVGKARQLGIRIIPISASGIDKNTEFLMRFLAISTNGTYVFITDDSGVGNPHLEPSVGQYTVELLNNLMVRLINEYSE